MPFGPFVRTDLGETASFTPYDRPEGRDESSRPVYEVVDRYACLAAFVAAPVYSGL